MNFWKKGFSRLHYPETLVENTIRHFIEMKVTEDVRTKQQVFDEHDAFIRIVLPVKAQKSANVVRHKLGDLSRKIDVYVQLFTQVRRSKDNFFFLHHICALHYRLCSACLLNARTRARSEKVNANHLPWQMEYQHALALTNLPSVAEHHSDICKRTFESIFNDSGHTCSTSTWEQVQS